MVVENAAKRTKDLMTECRRMTELEYLKLALAYADHRFDPVVLVAQLE